MTRKIELAMIGAIRGAMSDPDFSGCYWHNANTSVSQRHHGIYKTVGYERTIEVTLYDTVIAVIEASMQRLSLYTGGFNTATTRSRINALLREFQPSHNLAQRKQQLVLLDAWNNTKPFHEGFTLGFEPCAPLRESRWNDTLRS